MMTFDEKRSFLTFRAAYHAHMQDICRLEQVARVLMETIEKILEHPVTKEQKAIILKGVAEIRQLEKTELMESILPESKRAKLIPP